MLGCGSRQLVPVLRMFVSFLAATFCALRAVSTCPAPTLASCSYGALPPTTRQLLQRVDQALPQVVAQLRHTNPRESVPYVEIDSCFRVIVLPQLFTGAAEAPMRHNLRQFYYKQLADPSLQHQHTASLLVLAYSSVEAATHAQHLQDSLYQALQQRCQGQIRELEPCVELASHRFTRMGAHLLHYTLYSQDPLWRSSLRQLAVALTGRLRDTTAASASGRAHPAVRRQTTP
jgi:hypothetical protein